MAKITTPVKGFTGEVAGVAFAKGVGETDDPIAIGYFERRGYTVEGVQAPPKAKSAAKGKAPAKGKAKAPATTPVEETAPAAAETTETGDENADAGNGDGDQSTAAE